MINRIHKYVTPYNMVWRPFEDYTFVSKRHLLYLISIVLLAWLTQDFRQRLN